MKIWKGGGGILAPVEVEAEEFGWPNWDSNGDVQYENTHFRTEEEAWQSIKANSKADISLIGHRIINLQEKLREAQAQAGNAAAEFAQIIDGYNAFVRRMVTDGKH